MDQTVQRRELQYGHKQEQKLGVSLGIREMQIEVISIHSFNPIRQTHSVS